MHPSYGSPEAKTPPPAVASALLPSRDEPRHLPDGTRGLLPLPSLPLYHGGRLEGAALAYELAGPDSAPAVAVLGGISAGRHVTADRADPSAGWWQALAGPGRALDTRRFRLVSFDFLGGNGASTGHPALPEAGAGESFPAVDTRDQARALACLLDHLGIDRLHSFAGASYGGMVALAFAAGYPERLGRLLVVSAAHESHPRSTAWRAVQRRMVRFAAERGEPGAGLALARALAMTTYRTPEELASRFGGPPRREGGAFRFPIEDYLDARGADFAASFRPEAFLCLSLSLDLHRVDPQDVRTPATLVAVDSDALVPLAQMRSLERRLGGPGRLVTLRSRYGHDAFLKETAALGTVLYSALAAGAPEEVRR